MRACMKRSHVVVCTSISGRSQNQIHQQTLVCTIIYQYMDDWKYSICPCVSELLPYHNVPIMNKILINERILELCEDFKGFGLPKGQLLDQITNLSKIKWKDIEVK